MPVPLVCNTPSLGTVPTEDAITLCNMLRIGYDGESPTVRVFGWSPPSEEKPLATST